MANHVIYDQLWESDRLERCSRDAALAYPWIFLVADDHGRFEYKPRAIWKNAFAYRNDVTVDDVAKWLDEYWREGLLIRYHVDGGLAHWYKFRGRKPSERRASDFPDPDGMPTLRYGAADIEPPRGDASPLGGDDTAVPPRERGVRDRSEIEQIRDRAGAGAGTEPPAYVPPPDIRTENAIREAKWKRERKLLELVGKIAEKTGKDATAVMRTVTAYKRRADDRMVDGRTNPALLTDERLDKSLADAEGWLEDIAAGVTR